MITTHDRFKACGVRRSDQGGVVVRVTDSGCGRRSGFAGLQTCGSVWTCPVCATKIQAERRGEVEQALSRWCARGGRLAFVTLTVRHYEIDSLKRVWDSVSGGWGRVTSGADWKAEQSLYGTPSARWIHGGCGMRISDRIHFVKAVEATRSANGWHVHIHALLFLRPGVTDADLSILSAQMFNRWSKGVLASGGRAPDGQHGINARLLDPGERMPDELAAYFTKASWEAVSGATKKGRSESRTPFQILADIGTLGDRTDYALWAEWEAGSLGRRQFAWSAGLREMVGLGQARTDEVIAADDLGGEDAATISPSLWSYVVAVDARCDILDAFRESHEAGYALLEALEDARLLL